jgi:hypothetical protein
MAPFDTFLQEFGVPSSPQVPSEDLIRQFTNVLPAEMIDFWRAIGLAPFEGGLVWIINPKQLEDVMAEFIPENEKGQPPVAVVRTAFGKIIYWHRGAFTLLDPNHNDSFGAGDDVELLFDLFLVGEDARIGILQQPLFKDALRRFGPLNDDEMYGYKLPLALGGDRSIRNMEKMRLREQLSILAQIWQETMKTDSANE